MWVQSKIWRQGLKIGVLQGSKTTSAFCKLCLPNFARDKTSNHDYKNSSKISAVTWFRICPVILHFQTFMFFTPPYCTVNSATVQQLQQLQCINALSWRRSISYRHQGESEPQCKAGVRLASTFFFNFGIGSFVFDRNFLKDIHLWDYSVYLRLYSLGKHL